MTVLGGTGWVAVFCPRREVGREAGFCGQTIVPSGQADSEVPVGHDVEVSVGHTCESSGDSLEWRCGFGVIQVLIFR